MVLSWQEFEVYFRIYGHKYLCNHVSLSVAAVMSSLWREITWNLLVLFACTSVNVSSFWLHKWIIILIHPFSFRFNPTGKNCEGQQCFSWCISTRYQGVLFLLWWYRICWNAKVFSQADFIFISLSSYDACRLSLFSLSYSGDEWSQIAYVTFKDSQGAETAMLLSVCAFLELLLCFCFRS